MNLHRWWTVVLALVAMGVTITALSGCGPSRESSQDRDGAAWSEPQWMADQRVESEEFVSAMRRCMLDLGYDVAIDPAGGFSTSNSSLTLTELMDAIQQCMSQLGTPSYLTLGNPEDYSRMLDTRECLIAHGYELEPAPSYEHWVDSDREWSPYWYLYSKGLMSNAKVTEMQAICLQGSGGLYVSDGGPG